MVSFAERIVNNPSELVSCGGDGLGFAEFPSDAPKEPAETMSCSTRHNVHQQERDLTHLAHRCLQCHQVNRCNQAGKTGVPPKEQCLDCHMPNQESKLVRIETAMAKYSVPYRNHTIGVYPRSSKLSGVGGSPEMRSGKCTVEALQSKTGDKSAEYLLSLRRF